MKHTPLKDFPKSGRQWYLDHNENVRNLVPKNRFLEFNAKEGWEPLCEFLGTDTPTWEYPSANQTEVFQKGVDRLWLRFRVKKYREFLRYMSVCLVGFTSVFALLEYSQPTAMGGDGGMWNANNNWHVLRW